MEFRATKVRAAYDWDGNIEITFTVDKGKHEALSEALREISGFDDIEVEAKKHRERRSLDANAYFHVLVAKIAAALGLGNDEVKRRMNMEYGTWMKDDDGKPVGLKLPEGVKPESVYPYLRRFDRRSEGGKWFNCYLLYKRTHELDTREMSRLIDGTVKEAEELGIETATPQEIALMMQRYEERMSA